MTAFADFTAKPRIRFAPTYDERPAFLFLAPLAAVLLAVAVFPIFYSFYISLFSLKLTRPNRVPFVGLDNYTAMLSAAPFGRAGERPVGFAAVPGPARAGLAGVTAPHPTPPVAGLRTLGALLPRPLAIA